MLPFPHRLRLVLQFWLALGGLSAGPLAAALPASAESGASETFWGALVSILLPLSLVIGALLIALFVARRHYRVGGREVPLKVLQMLPVGPRERVVVVETRAGRVLALGVSAQQVNLLGELRRDDVDSNPLDRAGPLLPDTLPDTGTGPRAPDAADAVRTNAPADATSQR